MAPVDEALAAPSLQRQAKVTVRGFAPAIALAGETDLVATVPEQHTRSLWRGLHRFARPMPVAEFTIALFWHPRLDADPAHRWLRSVVADTSRPTRGRS